MFEAMIAETIGITGHNGDTIQAYYARPITATPVPGVIVLHHMPGWDEWSKEVARKLAYHGYAAICPHLFSRFGPGRWDDIAAAARGRGGAPDVQVVGDAEGAAAFLRAQPDSNGNVGVIGFCSGGRQAYMLACKMPSLDAAVDCWGGRVVAKPEELTPQQPVAVIDMTRDMSCPLLGIFGNDDANPDVEQVNRIEEELKRYGVTIRYVSLRLGDSAEDRLLKNVRASIAEYEREKIKMRTQRGLREKAERGQVVGGGRPPYGYRHVRDERQIPYTLEPDSVTAPILQRIFRMLPSLSSVDLARQLDAERIPAPNGSGWHPGTIRRIVTSTVYLGLWIYGRRGRQIGPEDSADVIRVPVPQLVDRPT